MPGFKNSAIQRIEEKIKGMKPDSLRARVLTCAKDFKTSWFSLGEALYSIWKDKIYKEWGYQQFETYASKEIGVKKETAMKLLKSYSFLEKEEPEFIRQIKEEGQQNPATLPGYEAINTLRMVKNKKNFTDSDYSRFKKDVFENGKDHRELKKELTFLAREKNGLNPQENEERTRSLLIKKTISALKSFKKDAEILKIVPQAIISETARLIEKLEAQAGEAGEQ